MNAIVDEESPQLVILNGNLITGEKYVSRERKPVEMSRSERMVFCTGEFGLLRSESTCGGYTIVSARADADRHRLERIWPLLDDCGANRRNVERYVSRHLCVVKAQHGQ